MHCVEKQRLKRLAVKRVIRNDVLPCRKCGGKSFSWDTILRIKTCKNDKCNDVSGVI